MTSIERSHPLRKLFDGLIEQVFMVELGICDTALTTYLGEILADFVHIDRIYRLRDVDNEVIRELSQMEALAREQPGLTASQRRRLVNKYIGDFTLFWAGVYPESLRPRHQGGIDALNLYVRQGKRSYGIASELTGTNDAPPAELLQQLSAQFEYCVHGLHLVREGWEQLRRAPRDN